MAIIAMNASRLEEPLQAPELFGRLYPPRVSDSFHGVAFAGVDLGGTPPDAVVECNQGLGRVREIREAASAILSCVAWENQISTQRSNSTSRCSSMSRNVGSRSASLT